MGDFHQNGVITTLHNLSNRSVDEMEKELLEFSKTRPMALILPSLYSELQGAALPAIIDQLKEVPYLRLLSVWIALTNISIAMLLGFSHPCPSTIGCCGMMARGSKLWMQNFRHWGWLPKNSARDAMSGTAWAIPWPRAKLNLWHCTTVI